MKQTIDLYTFRDEFMKIRPNNFSYVGLEVLFEYLEQLEDDCEEEMTLDVIALCCDYAESTINELVSYYALDKELDGFAAMDDDEKKEAVLEWLSDNTIVCGESYCGGVNRLDDAVVYLSSF